MKRYTVSSDRRASPRILVSVPVKIKVKNPISGITSSILAETREIGEGGLSLFSKEPLALSSIITLYLDLSPNYDIIQTRAVIMWRNSYVGERLNKFYYGMRFVDLPGKSRYTLKRYINDATISKMAFPDRRRYKRKSFIKSSITVKQDARRIYNLLKEMEQFPWFIAGVENVKVRNISENKKITEWKIDIMGTPMSWQEEDIFDKQNMEIRFKMLEGSFANYYGEWKVSKNPTGAMISFSVNIDWSVADLKGPLGPILDHKARLAVRWSLREIREKTEIEDFLKEKRRRWRESSVIVSEVVEYENSRGKKIIGFYDHLKKRGPQKRPFIIVPPSYGETKKDSLTLSYYLVKNGFNVIRYDGTNHVGESEGDIISYTLSNAKDDLKSTLNFVARKFKVSEFGIITRSLAKRVAIKLAGEDARVKFVFGLVGIIDLQRTLKAIHREDVIGKILRGKSLGRDFIDTFGFEVNIEFLRNAINDGYHNLATTKKDLKKVKTPMIFLIAEKDPWVKIEDVKLLFDNPHLQRKLYVLPNTMHQVYENPTVAKRAIRLGVVSCLRYLCNKNIRRSEVIEPTVREIAIQNRIEKERLRKLITITKETEKEFWSKYLTNYRIINKSQEYRDFMILINELLGKFREGAIILDAGCGIGLYGGWLLVSRLEEIKKIYGGNISSYKTSTYLGLDFTENALKEAKDRHNYINNQIHRRHGFDSNRPIINWRYILADLDYRLPFKDNCFDKICCNLVVSYLTDPTITIRELFRVLKRRGKIVITSLKPFNDLSQIYCNFLDKTENKKDIEEAKKLFIESGKIKYKEDMGHYKFFSEEELKSLLVNARGERTKTYRSFGNQANVAFAEKV